MFRRGVDYQQVRLGRTVDLSGVEVPGFSSLKEIDPLLLMPEDLMPKVLLTPLGERACSPSPLTRVDEPGEVHIGRKVFVYPPVVLVRLERLPHGLERLGQLDSLSGQFDQLGLCLVSSEVV